MLGLTWIPWKHAMAAYAKAHNVRVPAGFTAPRDRCGKSCTILLKRIQAHAGMTQDGILGPRTTNLLRNYLPEHDHRKHIVQVCDWTIQHAASISYAQVRPMQLTDCVLPLVMDCSKHTTWVSYWAGWRDPNGLHFSGEGNTETIYNHLPRITLAQARPGDLVVWGGAYIQPLSHVVTILEPGTDPMVCSHGSEIGPLRLRLSAEQPYHAGLARTVHSIG